MCGIVGVTGNKNAVDILVNGLAKLEYRGYDSAGIYVDNLNGDDYLVKTTGTIKNLKEAIGPQVHGISGIGHTRWATHGKVTVNNAHPQVSANGRFYLVHNGVIENYKELKNKYLKNTKLVSDTDTEVLVQMVEKFVEQDHLTTKQAFTKAVSLLHNSSYAFILMDREEPETLYVAKNKSPLLLGLCDGFNVVSSDAVAMLNVTNKFMEINDGEIVVVKPHSISMEDKDGHLVEHRETFKVDMDASDIDRGTYPYYMMKEIDEQPNIMRRLSKEYLSEDGKVNIPTKLLDQMKNSDRLYIIGAGTSYHAGLVGKKLFERLTGIPTEVDLSSEMAYDDSILSKKPFFIFLSQSGETADSRQVLVKGKAKHIPSLTITNVPKSTLSREADYTLLLNAGPEISVASTKAYTAQVALQAILAKALGETLNNKHAIDLNLKYQMGLVANGMQAIIDDKEKLDDLSKEYFVNEDRAFYLGRGLDYATSLEAALKLKEISYLQAEGFASGELKHGPIALIEPEVPVVATITQKKTAGLTRSNLEETMSRGSNPLTISRRGLAKPGDNVVIPDVDESLMPLLSIIPMQLLAYYTSLNKGLNVDKPRNLAKSVTVE